MVNVSFVIALVNIKWVNSIPGIQPGRVRIAYRFQTVPPLKYLKGTRCIPYQWLSVSDPTLTSILKRGFFMLNRELGTD